MGWFLLPPEWKGREDVYQSPAEGNNALPWLPSTARSSLEKHTCCHPHQSLREGTSQSTKSSLACSINPRSYL